MGPPLLSRELNYGTECTTYVEPGSTQYGGLVTSLKLRSGTRVFIYINKPFKRPPVLRVSLVDTFVCYYPSHEKELLKNTVSTEKTDDDHLDISESRLSLHFFFDRIQTVKCVSV